MPGAERPLTLQKSIDLTPLLPSAGPTGGLGLACPAPMMSLTSWSAMGPDPRALDMTMARRWRGKLLAGLRTWEWLHLQLPARFGRGPKNFSDAAHEPRAKDRGMWGAGRHVRDPSIPLER